MLDKKSYLHDDDNIHIPTREELQDFIKGPKSFWSCSHLNCCLQNILHINLHILYIILFKTS